MHGKGDLASALVRNNGDGFIDGVGARLCHGFHGVCAEEVEGNKNLMGKGTLGNSAEVFACAQNIAGLGGGSEVPLLLKIQTFCVNASLQEPAGSLCQLGKGILQAIVHLTEQTRSEMC